MPKKRQIRTYAVGHPHGRSVPEHYHDWDQLVYAVEGTLTVRTDEGTWVVPPTEALWVPAWVRHSWTATGFVSLRTLYLEEGVASGLQRSCTVVHTTPLLRELIQYAMSLGALAEEDPGHAPLVAFVFQLLEEVETLPLSLPDPADRRARRAAEILRADPGSARSLEEVGRKAGASLRTLQRLFKEETGLTLARWRRRLRILHVLPMLQDGGSVTRAAYEAGYANPSSFIAAFKELMGETPSQYVRAPRGWVVPRGRGLSSEDPGRGR